MDHPIFDPSQVLVVVGPTGSGKTELAVDLAERHNGEIVCMDSMQLYAQLSIGTARPTEAEMRTIPHHLFGEVDLFTNMTSLSYRDLAIKAITAIQNRGKRPILVGGTGLYLRALFEGFADLPVTPPGLRSRLSQMATQKGPAHLVKLLRRLDPQGAAQLHPNDTQRIQRFLEVRLLSGTSVLDHWARQEQTASPKPVVIGLNIPKQVLWSRLEARAEAWLKAGWIAETQKLLDSGLFSRVLHVGPIGYREIGLYLEGSLPYDQLQQRIFFATRQYAKRQMTWFRKVSYIEWFPYEAELGYNKERVSGFIEMKWGNRTSSFD